MEAGLRVVLVSFLLFSSLGSAMGVEAGELGLPPVDVGCDGARCAWALPSDAGPLSVGWSPFVEEVRPHSWSSDVEALRVAVEGAGRGGTFMLSSLDPVPAPATGTFSTWLRASGDVTRFVILLREVGHAGAPELGDTVFTAPAHTDWTFVSFQYERRLAEATEVRIALRGEIAEGGTGELVFSQPRLSADTTAWYLDDSSEPFARGPYAALRFSDPGDHVIRAVGAVETTLISARAEPDPPTIVAKLDLDSSMRVRALVDASSPFHPSLVMNGGFVTSIAGWRLAPHEFGLGDGSMSFDNGSLRLTVPHAAVNGSIWATQTVAVTPGIPLEFVWRAHDDRGIAGYALAVIDGTTRHESTHAPAGPLGVTERVGFTPKSSTVELQLRVIYSIGGGGSAWVEEVDLRRAYSYDWTLDGAAVDADGPAAVFSAGTVRGSAFTVDVTDAFGTATRNVGEIPLSPLGVESELVLVAQKRSRVGLVQEHLPLTVALANSVPFDSLSATKPWLGWELEDGEAPGNIRLNTIANRLTLSIVGGEEAVGGGVQRRLATPMYGLPLDLRFEYRTTGDAERVQAISRYHSPGDASFEENRVSLPAAAEWTQGVLRASGTETRSVTLLGLRAIVPAGGEGTVAFRNVTYAPALTFEWQGAQSDGPVARLRSDSPGIHEWRASATLPSGVILSTGGEVYFTPVIRPFVTLDGVAGALWNSRNFPPDEDISLEGAGGATVVSAAAGSIATSIYAPGEYRVFTTSPTGVRTFLGNATLQGVVDVLLTGPTWQATRNAPFVVSLQLDNPTITKATLKLTSPWGKAHLVPLERNLSTGTWDGTWTTHLRNAAGAYQAELELADDRGSTASFELASLPLAASPGQPNGSGTFTLLTIAAVVAFWVPRRNANFRDIFGRLAISAVDALAVFMVTLVVAFGALGGGIPDTLESAVFAVGTLAGLSFAFIPFLLSDRGGVLALVIRTGAIAAVIAAALFIAVTFMQAQSAGFAGFPRRIILIAVVPWFATSIATRLAWTHARRALTRSVS